MVFCFRHCLADKCAGLIWIFKTPVSSHMSEHHSAARASAAFKASNVCACVSATVCLVGLRQVPVLCFTYPRVSRWTPGWEAWACVINVDLHPPPHPWRTQLQYLGTWMRASSTKFNPFFGNLPRYSDFTITISTRPNIKPYVRCS